MSEDRFKFIKELKYCQGDVPKENIDPEKQKELQKTKKTLVFCHFKDIREQTPNEEGKPFKCLGDIDIKEFSLAKKDQRCYFHVRIFKGLIYQGNMLEIYSRGGQEFIVPIHFKIQNVFPIEDGLIIKALYNRDEIYYDPFLNSINENYIQNYAYLTITNHPLDDIHPLSMHGSIDLINSNLDLLYVSYKIPLCIFYNPKDKLVSICIIKEKQESQMEIGDIDDDSYIKSIDPSSRNHDLYNVSKDFKLYLEELSQIPQSFKPDSIVIQKGLVNSYEIVLAFHFKSQKKLHLYSIDARQPSIIKGVRVIDNAASISQISFNRNNLKFQDSLRIVSNQLYTSLNQLKGNQKQTKISFELKFMKKRIKLLKKNLVVLDAGGRIVTFYEGSVPLIQVDVLASIIESQIINSKSSIIISKNTSIDSLSDPLKSSINLILNTGQSKRFIFGFQINDFTVRSIIRSFKAILPEQVYISFFQDVFESFSKSNNQDQTSYDQFTHFANMLLSLLTGEAQTLIPKQHAQTIHNSSSQQTVMDQKVQQQSQQIQSNAKPSSALQTKILRSSTTSFGGDSLSRRKMGTGQQQQQIKNQQQVQTQQQQIQTSHQRGTMRSSLTGTQLSQNQFKRVATGSSEIQPLTTSLSRSQPTQIIGNPFGELLNSDFHRENFSSKFKDLFPTELKLQFQTQQQNIPTDQLPSQIQNQSPTKSVSNKSATNTGPASRVSSTRQANLQNQERRSSTNSQISQMNSPSSQSSYKTSRSDFVLQANNMLFILHLMHEDLKLNKLRELVECPKLARLIFRWIMLTEPIKKSAYVDYYLKEYPFMRDEYEIDLKRCFKGNSIVTEDADIEPVPQLYYWLETYFRDQKSLINFPYPIFFERTRKVSRIYEILSGSKQNSFLCSLISSQKLPLNSDASTLTGLWMSSSKKRVSELYTGSQTSDYLMNGQMKDLHLFEKILFCLKEENLSIDEIKKLPTMISLPIIEIIRFSRLFQQEVQSLPKWPDSLYKLIQREDILNNLRLFERLSLSQGVPLVSQHSFKKQGSKKFALTRGMTNVFSAQTIEEMRLEAHRKEMESNILQTAGDVLNNNSDGNKDKQQRIDPDGSNNNSGKGNYLAEFLKNRFNQDTRYKEVSNMLASNSDMIIKLEHINNHESLPEDKIHQEKQSLLDRLFQRQLSKCAGRGALNFGTQQTLPTEILFIPKISQTGYVPQTESYMSVEFKDDQSKDLLQWPEFHNGVAAALRIASCLRNQKDKMNKNQSYTTRNWIMYHKPSEPKYEHGGFLLAIGLLGQLDSLQPTDIYQHLKTTHDATAIGILLGRAASKIGTMDDHDTRTLCIHIPYLLPPSLSIDISLSIQSAAVIGAGLLYKGTSNRLMTEMLLAQIGRKPLSDKSIEREGYALASGIALGLVNLGVGGQMQGISDLKLNERLVRFVEGGKTIDLPQSMLSVNFNHDNAKCSAIKEGDMVNVHITSPGAVIALALIHLKSNNENIASKLSMPQTFYSLEFVRPSFLLLKVLCKNLIMWDQITCSKEWIYSQIPAVIRDIYENDINVVEKKFSQRICEDEIDYSTIALCYVNIIAGAILSLGFKYAGTGNKEVFTLIADFIAFYRKLKIVQPNKESVGTQHTNLTKNQIDKNTVETCLCVAALSLSIVMAGTGDTDCFRILRVLRKRFEAGHGNDAMHYGFNMAVHMSLGFLFLGSGAYTFSRNNLSIAALLCSLYPVFPNNPNDNRYHLQGLRHFYVLAIETRLLQARDIDSGEFVNIQVDVEIEEKESGDSSAKVIQTCKMQTPAIVNGKIRKIEVKNSQYHYICLRINKEQEDMMEIDDENGTGMATEYKSQVQGLKQSNLQQIIYVKKMTSYTNQDADQRQQPASVGTKEIPSQISRLFSSNDEQYVKALFAEYPTLLSSITQNKDPQIDLFFRWFSLIDHRVYSAQQFIDMPEMEEVLLAQCRDPFNQLGVDEFFKVQEQHEAIKQQFSQCILTPYIKRRLLTLDSILNCCKEDKIEASGILLEQLGYLEQSTVQNKIKNLSFLKAYLKFIEQPIFTKLLMKSKSICDSYVFSTETSLGTESSQNDLLVKETIKSFGENFITCRYSEGKGSYHDTKLVGRMQELCIGMQMGPYEIHQAKKMVDDVLNELRTQGEGELADQYCTSKVMNEISDVGPLQEINYALNLSLQQLFGEISQGGQRFIDKVMIPGLLMITHN